MEKFYNPKQCMMYNKSISVLFGRSPLISYICGCCNSYNQTRLPLRAIMMDAPYDRCYYCNNINIIPVKMTINGNVYGYKKGEE